MYIGEYTTRLDDKGRITVPSAMRNKMEAFAHVVWYACRGLDQCVSLYHQQEWEKLCAQARQFPAMDANALDFRRMFFGGAAEVRLDGQGRIPLPTHLREYAGIDKDVAVIGIDQNIELWDKDTWREFMTRKQADYKAMAAAVFARREPAKPGAAEGEERSVEY